MNYLYPRANLDFNQLEKLAEQIQSLSLADLIHFNFKSNEMPWSSGCTVRLYPNNPAASFDVESPGVDDLLQKLNSLNQENISFLAKITSTQRVGIAYTFTLPPPPPNGGG